MILRKINLNLNTETLKNMYIPDIYRGYQRNLFFVTLIDHDLLSYTLVLEKYGLISAPGASL